MIAIIFYGLTQVKSLGQKKQTFFYYLVKLSWNHLQHDTTTQEQQKISFSFIRSETKECLHFASWPQLSFKSCHFLKSGPSDYKGYIRISMQSTWQFSLINHWSAVFSLHCLLSAQLTWKLEVIRQKPPTAIRYNPQLLTMITPKRTSGIKSSQAVPCSGNTAL